jgi:hypothetical protein
MSAVQQALLGYGSPATPFTGAWVQSATFSAPDYRAIVEGGNGDIWASTQSLSGAEYVTRVNSNGVAQWELRMPIEAVGSTPLSLWGAIGYSAVDDSLIVGMTNNNAGAYVLAKIAANGSITWQRQFTQNGGPAGASGDIKDIVVDSSGNIYICGMWIGSGAVEAFVACLNSTATSFTWQRRWASGTSNEFLALTRDGNGNIFASGYLNGRGSLVKLNSSGVWQAGVQKSDTISVGTIFSRVSCDSSGNVYTNTHRNGVSKYNNSLTHQWTSVANDSTTDTVSSCIADSSGNSYEVCGISGGGALIIKRAPSGAENWRRQINASPGGVNSVNTTKKAISLAGSNFMALPTTGSGTVRFIRLPTNSGTGGGGTGGGGWPNGTYNGITFTTPGATSTTGFTAASMTQPTSSTTVFNTPTTSTYTFGPLNTGITSTVVNIPFEL